MDARSFNLQLLTKEELQHLLYPINTKLEVIDKKLNKSSSNEYPGYFRNKDLKEKFGLSANSIIKYRESGLIPYTKIGDVFLYPIDKLDEMLKNNSNWDLFK